MESKEESFAKKLLHIIDNTNRKTYNLFLTTSERNELAKTCISTRCCFDWNFNLQTFYETFIKYEYPPLEFLWKLNIFQVMPLQTYIQNISPEKDFLQKFTKSVFRLCSQDVEEDDTKYMTQTGFLSYFISKAFPPEDVKNYDIKIKEICLETIILLLQGIFSTRKDEMNSKRFICFFSVWNAGILEETSFLNFCLFALDYFLNLLPIVKGLDAFEILENPCSSVSLFHFTVVVEKLLKPLKPDRICHILTFAVQKYQMNAASLLVVVKTFLRTHEEASVFISKLVSELMSKAYEKCNYEILLRTLLIGYQSMYQPGISPHIYYRLWLQNIFKEFGHSKNKDSISLLIQVLSDIVPYYKNIECLKVAIDLNVSLPLEAQVLYFDYITLLKTRIQDLKPSTKPEETVEKMLSLFKKLGKIPPVVMETSFLQKHKFLNEFLPALLVPRVIPPVPDLKEKFIEALTKAGKIPSNLLQKYKSSCMQEQNKVADMINENFNDFPDEDELYV